MALDVIGLSLAKSYTASSLEGAGALKGDPGKSAYEIDVSNGFTGTEAEWLESIKGEKGDDGQDGIYVTSMNISEDNKVTALLSNGNTLQVGTLNTVKGDKGDSGAVPRIDDETKRWFIGDYDTGYVAVLNTEISFNDLADVPTIPVAMSQLTNDENFIKKTVNNLINYHDKNTVYTKSEVNNLINNINRLTTSIVNELPTSDISDTTIYLIAATDSVYNQYMYIQGEWANLGNTSINLEEYVTITEMQAALIEKSDANHTHDELHSHGNFPLLETITAELIQKWNSKFSGNYNDLINKPNIPIVTNDLTNELKTKYDNATEKAHTHYKPFILEKFDEDANGRLIYNNNPIGNGGGGSGTAGKSAYEIAVDNGFVGTETEWLESLKGSDGDKGDNGTTPHIDETTKNWFIGDTDTGILAQGTDGKDGKSISTIAKDDDNNIIVTFTDGSTQNIGKLSVDIQGDFLTSDGFGNLRYYNGHFQYYDESSSTWIDTSVTPSNVYIMNMTPQEMKSIFGVYDVVLGKYKLKFEEPDDTVIDGQVACIVEKVVIRRKLGSVPISETDGDLVLEVKRKDFGTYKNEYFVDTNLSPSNGDVYYYKAFPMSTTGFYNNNSANETEGIRCKNYNLYGFKLDQNESNPASMITYLSDCDNKYYESAKMNYTTDTFDYGDWGDAWFIKNLKPCMLKYDGTVDYELDKNDYTKKLDGTASDVANASYGGNAMVGIPKVYWKIVNNGDNTANIYICDKKIDSDFHCWSHIDNNGNEIDYCYLSAFDGCNINSKLRSISGQSPMTNQSGTTEINYAKSNNIGSDIIWYTGLFNDWMLINILLFLIGKSTNSQITFGAGNNNTYVSASNTGIKKSGTMNTKGLFWGSNDNASGVKVFGIENFYGNVWKRIGGWINNKGTQKIKMTYGQSDGSTVDGYNTDGTGYIAIGNSTPIGTSGGYVSKVLFNKNGLIPTTVNGSQTTYYCDGLWLNNSQIDYALVGGASAHGYLVGAFYSDLGDAVSFAGWGVVAALSCKPLATT